MRNLIILLLLATIGLPQTFYGQANTENMAVNKSEKILGIRQTFKRINSDSSLRKKVIDDPEVFPGFATDGGGQLIGWFNKDSICKISAEVGLSFGTITDEYYFRNGRLIFVYEMEQVFPENQKADGLVYDKLKKSFEGRYYLDNNQVIDKIIKGRRRFGDKENTTALFLKDAKDYTKLLKTSVKKPDGVKK